MPWRTRSRWPFTGLRPTPLGWILIGTLLAAVPRAARAAESEVKIETQYQNESDPVRQAKLLAKLGPLEVERARVYLDMNDQEHALSVVEHYRDEVRRTTGELAATKVNAEKHASGYKELQIGLRESIRRFNDVILLLPVDQRAPFELVRSDLSSIQESLFEALFPTATEKSENKEAQQ